MANIKFLYGASAQLNGVSKVAGQLLFTTDTKRIYFDESATNRIQLYETDIEAVKALIGDLEDIDADSVVEAIQALQEAIGDDDESGSLSERLSTVEDIVEKLNGAATTSGSVAEAKKAADDAKASAQSALEEAQKRVESVTATDNKGIEIGGTATKPTVGIKLDPASGNAATLGANGLMVTIPEADTITVEEAGSPAANSLKSYQVKVGSTAVEKTIDIPKLEVSGSTTAGYTITYNGTKVGDIALPKDLVVQSGSVETDPDGKTGTYIVLVLNDESSTKIYIDVKDLVDTYTADNGTNNVTVTIDGYKISAKVAANGITSTELADNAVTSGKISSKAVTTEKIADNAITSAQIAEDAVTATELADNAVDTDAILNKAVTEDKLADALKAKINNVSALEWQPFSAAQGE